MGDTCNYHTTLVSDIAVIKNDISSIKDLLEKQDCAIAKHVEEGDKQGGYRDRLKDLEAKNDDLAKQISVIKKGYWKACSVSAIVGGLVARLAPDVIWNLIEYILKVGK